jgi:hypothetical protein
MHTRKVAKRLSTFSIKYDLLDSNLYPHEQ